MTPETKKTLIYGGVISFAIAAGLYIYSRYENQNSPATGADPTAANAAAQAAADAAAQQEVQLSELASFSGGGASLSSPSLGSETPPDNFAHEIATILQAAGLGPPVSPTSGSPTPVSTLPGVAASNPPPAPTDGTPPVTGPKPIGPEPSPARHFNYRYADERLN